MITRSPDAMIRYQYQAKALLRYCGLSEYDEVTQEHIDEFRRADNGLSPVTKEAYIIGFRLLTGKKFGGRKLKRPPKRPKLVSLDSLSKVYDVARRHNNRWMCRLLRFGYITGFRHSDLTRLRWEDIGEDAIEMAASKTNKLHVIPVHYILRGNNHNPQSGYICRKSDSTIYRWLSRYCIEAGVDYFTPQMIRRTAANEYEKAHPGAGGVLLGHSLKNISYQFYLDPHNTLKTAQQRLVIPEAMRHANRERCEERQKQELLEAWSGLPADDRKTFLRLMQKS